MLERVVLRNVVDEQCANGATIVRAGDSTVPLLASCARCSHAPAAAARGRLVHNNDRCSRSTRAHRIRASALTSVPDLRLDHLVLSLPRRTAGYLTPADRDAPRAQRNLHKPYHRNSTVRMTSRSNNCAAAGTPPGATRHTPLQERFNRQQRRGGHLDRLRGELHTNRGLRLQTELVPRESGQQIAFSHARVANQHRCARVHAASCRPKHVYTAPTWRRVAHKRATNPRGRCARGALTPP